MEEFSEVWMILVTLRDWHRIENLLSLSCAPAVPRPRDSHTSRAEATTAAVVLSDQATSGLSLTFDSASPLLPAVQSGRRHCQIRSMRQQFIPPCRTWVLTQSDCSPTTCAPPAVHDSAGKNFNFALGRETYSHEVWLPHYSRNFPAIKGSIIAQVTNDIEKGWKDMHSLLEKISNSGTLKPVLRFPFVSRRREGLRMKLTFFVSQASENFCDGPLIQEYFGCMLF